MKICVHLLILFVVSCNSPRIPLNYCVMLTADQSNVNYDKDSPAYESERANRHSAFVNNFNLIINETKRNGFPEIDITKFDSDACKYQAITMTILHML